MITANGTRWRRWNLRLVELWRLCDLLVVVIVAHLARGRGINVAIAVVVIGISNLWWWGGWDLNWCRC